MRTMLTVAVASLAGLLITAVPVVAHHSFAAEYDASKPIKLTGTVTKIEWTNPHCFFYIDVKNEQSGKIETIGNISGVPQVNGRSVIGLNPPPRLRREAPRTGSSARCRGTALIIAPAAA